jgi:hypothetical protein
VVEAAVAGEAGVVVAAIAVVEVEVVVVVAVATMAGVGAGAVAEVVAAVAAELAGAASLHPRLCRPRWTEGRWGLGTAGMVEGTAEPPRSCGGWTCRACWWVGSCGCCALA